MLRAPVSAAALWAASLICCCGTAQAVPAAPAAAPPPSDSADIDQPTVQQVEITGVRPGPSLWRVSQGDHVVWLLGTLDPLPSG